MDTLITQLDQKYAKYQNGLLTKKNKTSVFFMADCAYEYFCITENQPKIKEIIEQDTKALEKIKGEIITENQSPVVQKELIKNVEVNSLSFCYGEVFRDMYLPMSKHKNTRKLLSEKEIIGDTRVVGERLLNFERAVGVKIANFLGIPILKDADAGIALVKIGYSFNQKQYPMYMEKIHSLLTQKLLENYTQKQDLPTPEISLLKKIWISETDGIFREEKGKILSYTIRRISNRYKIVTYLLTHDTAHISDIATLTGQDLSLIIKEIKQININFRKKLKVNADLIIHHKTGGYSFNKSHFDVAQKL